METKRKDADRPSSLTSLLQPQLPQPQSRQPQTKQVSDQEISFQLLPSLAALITTKDIPTGQHSERVGTWAAEWIEYRRQKWQWLEHSVQVFDLAARLHDLGKVGVLDEILHKPGALTATERDHMQLHAEIGYQMIRDYPGAAEIAVAVRHHHERWDGQGYPLGLSGDRIPWAARAIAIIDAFDAMTSHRHYRTPVSEREAIEELQREAGRQFDPNLVQDFVEFYYSRRT
jgi:HD-GYP domain-containing protein (c-di-GMP phosphodiesterase class II)